MPRFQPKITVCSSVAWGWCQCLDDDGNTEEKKPNWPRALLRRMTAACCSLLFLFRKLYLYPSFNIDGYSGRSVDGISTVKMEQKHMQRQVGRWGLDFGF